MRTHIIRYSLTFIVIASLTISCSKDEDNANNENQNFNTITDQRDGKKYKTVKVGNQTWFAENLNFETNNSFCYNNNQEYCITYGRLYTWHAAMIACPEGWHLPDLNEWQQLTSNLGTDAGGKLKEKGYDHWKKPNTGATNEVGFTAIPGGYGVPQSFEHLTEMAFFYTATVDSTEYGNFAMFARLTYNGSGVFLNEAFSGGGAGASVRCIKDQ